MADILVAFATKHHSTEEIAEAITSALRGAGHRVDCIDAAHASAEGYDAVILGSAVYMGRWRREAKRFLKKERDALSTMPFWIFSSGPVGDPPGNPDDADKWLEPKAVIELAESLGVREHVVFGGRIPPDPHGFIENAMTRNTPEEQRDNRDWDQIRTWAQTVATTLAGDRLEA